MPVVVPSPVPPSPPTRRALATSLVLAVLAGLLLALPTAATAADVTDGLVLRYDLTQASGTVGRGHVRATAGTARWSAAAPGRVRPG